jgi:thiol-disulfide isomerase/thioredoxin
MLKIYQNIGLILLFSVFVSNISFGQGMDFFHGTWEEALEEAKKEKRLIFVDAYTTWCGPCKRMSKNIFPLKEVGEFYNDNFINLKLDMEKGEGLKFRKTYPVSAFPTFLYIHADGTLVHSAKGGRDSKGFIALGKQALTKNMASSPLVEGYENGDRDPATVLEYVRYLNGNKKSSLKAVNDYFKGKEGPFGNIDLEIIYEGLTRVDSKIMGLFKNNLDDITKVKGAEAVKNQILSAAKNTVNVAIEYESLELLEEAKDVVVDMLPEEDYFSMESDFIYHHALRDAKGSLSAAKKIYKTFSDDREKSYYILEKLLFRFEKEESIIKFCGQVCDALDEEEIDWEGKFFQGLQLHFLGENEKASEKAEEGLKLAGNSREALMKLRKLKQSIMNSNKEG